MPLFSRSKETKTTHPELTIETSLSTQVLKMFAAVVQTSAPVPEHKRDFVTDFFDAVYPHDVVAMLMRRFDEYIEQGLDIATLAEELNDLLSYQEKIFCLLNLYEFIVLDGGAPDELELARALVKVLRIQESDADFIEHNFALRDAPPQSFIGSDILALRITGDKETADVYLPFPGLELIIYKIQNLYCITKKNDLYKVAVEGQLLKKNFSSRISQHFGIKINDYALRYQDLIIYFRNKVQPLDSALFVEQQDLDLAYTFEQSSNSLARLDVKGSIITLAVLDQEAVVARNRARMSKTAHVNLNDVVYVNGFRLDVREAFYYLSAQRKIPLAEDRTVYHISNDIKADVFIQDALQEKWSVTISREHGSFIFEGRNCPYRVYLNGRHIPLERKHMLEDGDTLFLHDNFLSLDLTHGVFRKSIFSFRKIIADALQYKFDDGSKGVDEVSFDVQYGELVGIMGPSGSGKSTLLNVLCGLLPPDKGSVRLDHYNLHEEYHVLKDYLGYVPQDDLLLANLTVYENLFYHARLRFPDRSKEEIVARIDTVLESIRLKEKRDTRVGQPTEKTLSGGERKRLNIGLELLSDAEIYFLDEPTSGLSSKDSENILDILGNIALNGKIVIVVIHQPGSKLFKLFNKIILLDHGGRLAYYGTTYSALEYFKRHMETDEAGDNVEVECPYCKTVQPDILLDSLEASLRDIDGAMIGERKYSPEYWKMKYRRSVVASWFSSIKLPTREMMPPSRDVSTKERFNQFRTLFTRNFTSKLRDRSNLLITFLETPLLGAGVGFILKYSPFEDYTLYTNDLFRTFLFIAVIVTIFLSMTNSVDEIIGDTSLLLRERMLNLTHRGYLASKLMVLTLFAIVQNMLFVALGFIVVEVKELYLPYVFFLTLLSYTGISMGLFISAIPKLSNKAAQNIVPLILIPQIILGGALIEYEKMNTQLTLFKNSPVPEICQIMPSRWAYEGLMVFQETHNSYDTEHDLLAQQVKEYKYKHEELIAAVGKETYDKTLKSLAGKLEDFRATHRAAYGNKNIHDAVLLGEKLYKQQLEDEKPSDSVFIRELETTYPLFVREKKLFFTDISIPTPTYNMLVTLFIAFFLNIGTLIMLRYRERMIWGTRVMMTAVDSVKKKVNKNSKKDAE